MLAAVGSGCRSSADGGQRFSLINPGQSGVSFTNQVPENDTFNITTYEYLYNGGGVAAADFNNDGLTDLYFTGNSVPNALYLNRGQLQFEDVTSTAGVAGRPRWKTGVNTVDINADGWQDIYLCYSGPGTDADRRNELYLNLGPQPDGVPRFREAAASYGLDAPGTFSTQCAFFDMDRDGDLDALLVNHADMFYNVFYNTTQLRRLRHPQFGNRLYRNDNGRFTDISEAAGISGSAVNFGLGVAIDDMNGDHWPDLYLSNDYNEQDFLYLNQQNGTFKEVLKQSIGHTSQFSMGVDMSDLNDDGLTDIISLDMLPEDNYRQKLLKGPEGYDYYQLLVDSGYHHQNMRNMLQLNMGMAPDGLPRFSEIGQLAGMSQTDWSWSPLVADFDNDGRKDIFISNGYLRDFTNLDFLKYTFAEAKQAADARGDTLFAWQVIKDLQGTPLPNYLYSASGPLQYQNRAPEWGLTQPGVSTGAAWADLDNDGDLDLVLNNCNQPASIYQNHSRQQAPEASHYLQLRLQQPGPNRHAWGAVVQLYSGGQAQRYSLFPARGFQSASQPVLHLGLGAHKSVDSVVVHWPGGGSTWHGPLPADTSTVLQATQGRPWQQPPTAPPAPLLAAAPANAGISYLHRTDGFVDFKRLLTLPHQISRQGPLMAVADVNADGNEDVLIGGNDVQPAVLYLQNDAGRFAPAPRQPWVQSRVPDGGLCFFDADADGDPDLYVARHGMQLNEGDGAYQHQLYLNDGRGSFVPAAADALPDMRMSSTLVLAADYNRDGLNDLLVAGRSVPGRYPVVPTTYLLRNVGSPGKPRFDYAREQQSALLRQPGMVTCGQWADLNNDQWPDLLLAGEYMAPTLLLNQQGQLTDASAASFGSPAATGWWCRLRLADVDGDGDTDLLAGNAGLNLPMKASEAEPVQLFYNDFDGNGLIDPVLTYYIKGVQAAALGLDDLAEQTPVLRKTFLRYQQYAQASWAQLYPAAQGTLVHSATELRSCLWRNDGKGHFTREALPIELQFSTLQALQVADLDGDSLPEVIAAGNYYPWRTTWGRQDACFGWVLQDRGKGWEIWYPAQSGLWLPGDVRDLQIVKGKAGRLLLASAYEGPLTVWQVLGDKKPR